MFGLKPQWVEIMLTRADLERKYPVERFLKYGNEVYLCWLSGQGVLPRDEQFLKNKCIRMILLPNPESDYVLLLRESLRKNSLTAFDFPTQIKTMTQMAQSEDIPVRWLKSYIGTNITIVNPTRQDGFIHLEPCLPHIQPNDRFSFRFEKPAREKEILAFHAEFGRLCSDDMSTVPPDLRGF